MINYDALACLTKKEVCKLAGLSKLLYSATNCSMLHQVASNTHMPCISCGKISDVRLRWVPSSTICELAACNVCVERWNAQASTYGLHSITPTRAKTAIIVLSVCYFDITIGPSDQNLCAICADHNGATMRLHFRGMHKSASVCYRHAREMSLLYDHRGRIADDNKNATAKSVFVLVCEGILPRNLVWCIGIIMLDLAQVTSRRKLLASYC